MSPTEILVVALCAVTAFFVATAFGAGVCTAAAQRKEDHIDPRWQRSSRICCWAAIASAVVIAGLSTVLLTQ